MFSEPSIFNKFANLSPNTMIQNNKIYVNSVNNIYNVFGITYC